MAVAEESVNAPVADAKPEAPMASEPAPAGAAVTIAVPPADAVAAPSTQPKMFGPEIATAAPAATSPPPVSQRPLADSEPAPASAAPAPGDAATANAALQAKADAASAEGSSGSGPEWIVNVMTVTDPDVAKQHIATLTSAGYPAMLRKEFVRGRASYRVVIGGISNEQGARRTAQLLSSKMGYTAAWPLQKR
ncbi:MAG: SPOR domain-containing protein [Panacagrimonas sp.]